MPNFDKLRNLSKIFLISGPSGVGKDTVLKKLKIKFPKYFYAITATSRPKRKNESDGEDYIFLSNENFKTMIRNNEMLEWATVYGNFYGVPASPILNAINSRETIIIKVDIQGVETLKQKFPESVSIFIAPPQKSDLTKRLKLRNTENAKSIATRLKLAEIEISSAKNFDYIVVNKNNSVDSTIKEIQKIIRDK